MTDRTKIQEFQGREERLRPRISENHTSNHSLIQGYLEKKPGKQIFINKRRPIRVEEVQHGWRRLYYETNGKRVL